ncbi:MAG: DUF1186 domain-containing protein [Chloroflexi bacterium]|nr:DUF1186 domain-containing protein [Chloroflexota bacterium]
MNIQEILEDLKYHTGDFPVEALREAVARKEEIIPELLKIIEDAIQRPETLDVDTYMAPIYAMYLLALFRERRAYPLLVRFVSMPGEVMMRYLGDIVPQHLHRILASVAHGDSSLIKGLVENEQANDLVRGAALQSLLTEMVQGEATREEVVAYYQSLFRGGLKRDGSDLWNELVSYSTALHPHGLMKDVRQAYADGLVSPGYIDLSDVTETLERGRETVLRELRESGEHRLIEDLEEDMGWWPCFGELTRCSLTTRREKMAGDGPGFDGTPKSQPAIKRQRIGRNEPCPCGSGKKYKKCCGDRR